jgi:hypothetical protein
MDFIETMQGCSNLNGLCWIVSNKKWTYNKFCKVQVILKGLCMDFARFKFFSKDYVG